MWEKVGNSFLYLLKIFYFYHKHFYIPQTTQTKNIYYTNIKTTSLTNYQKY